MAALNKTQSTAANGAATDADRMIDIAAGVADEAVVSQERRNEKRYPYTELVGAAQIDSQGGVKEAQGLQGKNISVGGICLTGRAVFTAGTNVVMQLVRSNGSSAIVGGRVQHCRYVGDMQHETGIVFTPLPSNVKRAQFIEESGRMRVLHPTLREQAKKRSSAPAASEKSPPRPDGP